VENEALKKELALASEHKKELQEQLNQKGEGIKIDGKPVTEVVRDYQTLQLDFEESQLLIRELDEQILEKEQIIQSMEQEGAEKIGAVPRSEYEALEIEIEDLKDIIEEMEEVVADKSYEIQSSHKRQLAATREAETYKAQLEELEASKSDSSASSKEGGVRRELERQLSAKDDMIESLVRESSSKKLSVRDHHKIKNELTEALSLIEEQAREIEDLNMRGEGEDDNSIQQLREDLSDCKRLLVDQDQEIAERDHTIESLQKKIATPNDSEHSSTDDKLKRRLAEKEMEIYVLEESLQAVTAELEDAERQLAQSNQKRRSGLSLNVEQDDADEWESSLSKSEESSKVSRQHYDTLKSQMEDALNLIDEQADDLEKKENWILQLQDRSVDDDALSRLTEGAYCGL
jgi:DNA repair exonuclease SbcCD ATPase subunit